MPPLKNPVHPVAHGQGFTCPSVQGIRSIAVAFVFVVGLKLATARESSQAWVADELGFEVAAEHGHRLVLNEDRDLLNGTAEAVGKRFVDGRGSGSGPVESGPETAAPAVGLQTEGLTGPRSGYRVHPVQQGQQRAAVSMVAAS